MEVERWGIREVGRAVGGQTIYYFYIKRGPNRYEHYLDCPLRDTMARIKGQMTETISLDALERAIAQFQKMLERKERD